MVNSQAAKIDSLQLDADTMAAALYDAMTENGFYTGAMTDIVVLAELSNVAGAYCDSVTVLGYAADWADATTSIWIQPRIGSIGAK
jgi:hypothetical protein